MRRKFVVLHENVTSWMQILKFLHGSRRDFKVRMEADADQGQEITRKLFENKKQQQTSKKKKKLQPEKEQLTCWRRNGSCERKKRIALKYISLF